MWANIKSFFLAIQMVNSVLKAIKTGIAAAKAWAFEAKAKKQDDANQVISDGSQAIQADKEKPIESQSNEDIKKVITGEEGVKPGGVPAFPIPGQMLGLDYDKLGSKKPKQKYRG